MEAASRWETEAIRESRDRRRGRPTVSQRRKVSLPDGDWRTLREASEETGIPIGTLRKWCRRESVDSYLESDGDQTLRMLEMASVRSRAKAMGREIGEQRAKSQEPGEGRQPPAPSPQPETATDAVPTTDNRQPTTAGKAGTMIVPVDAWNKMLNQLGNLHEAGQQLAEARERAGKAETEAKFLRERLAEMRNSYQPPVPSHPQGEGQQATDDRRQAEEGRQTNPTPVPPAQPSSSPSGGGAAEGGGGGQSVPNEDTTEPTPVPPAQPSSSPSGGGAERSEAEGVEESYQPPAPSRQPETTSFWRYVVRGWRGRKR